MADEPWQIRLFQEAKASPGFWAWICLAVAAIGGGVLGLNELKPEAFEGFVGVRGYGWLAVLIGGVLAIFFAAIHWWSQPRSSSPEVPYMPVAVSPPPAQPAIPDLIR